MDDLKLICNRLRGELIEISHLAKTPHLGGQLSCVEMLVACYWRFLRIDSSNLTSPDRDRFILSKGHAAPALYVTLAEREIISRKLLASYAQHGSPLAEQPVPNAVPGIEAATGSLGHGLSIGVGLAISAKLLKLNSRVVVLLSDGECNEGSVWEAAMFAAAQKLSNLVVLVDFNKWQATGRTEEVMALSPLSDKWRAFGFETHEVNGHSVEELVSALDYVDCNSVKPTAIVGHTIKGKGVSFMEDDNNWHYRIPTDEEVQKAKKELGLL